MDLFGVLAVLLVVAILICMVVVKARNERRCNLPAEPKATEEESTDVVMSEESVFSDHKKSSVKPKKVGNPVKKQSRNSKQSATKN